MFKLFGAKLGTLSPVGVMDGDGEEFPSDGAIDGSDGKLSSSIPITSSFACLASCMVEVALPILTVTFRLSIAALSSSSAIETFKLRPFTVTVTFSPPIMVDTL